MRRYLPLIGGSALLFALPAVAEEYPLTSTAFAETNLPCYMHIDSQVSLDLTTLCNPAALASDPVDTQNPDEEVSSPSTSSSSDVCNFPDDLDSAGNPCGDRAVSEQDSAS